MPKGKCGCGAVTYSLAVEPMVVHCCHCSWCQRETGSAFAINILVESEALSVTGETVATDRPTESGGVQTVHSCPNCGSVVWSHYGGMGDKIAFVRGGTLDDPSKCPPSVHIYTDSKQEWVALPDAVPAYAGYYKMRDVWSDEAVNRFKATRG